MLWFYRLANVALRAVFAIILDYRVTGLENVPRRGPLIACINHTSFIDPLLVGIFFQRYVTMMAKVELFRKPMWGWVMHWYGAFPVHRGEVDRGALRKALEILRRGGVLLMAPEGTRSKTGLLQRGKDGMTMIALRTGATVLPVGIWGGKHLWRNLARLRRTPVSMVVGKPYSFAWEGDRPSREELSRMTEEGMYRLAALLPPELRGPYSDLSQATERFLVSTTGSSGGGAN